MDPWKLPESQATEEAAFHLLRLTLFVAGTAGWLLAAARPTWVEPLALAGALLGSGLGCLGGSRFLRGCWLAAATVLLLWVFQRTEEPALWATVVAVALGAPLSVGRRYARPWYGAVAVATALVAGEGAGLRGMLLGVASLLTAAWFGDLYAAYRGERQRLESLVQQLTAAQTRLSRLAAQARDRAAQRERQEVLGAVHDALGHTLTAHLLQVSVARRLMATDPMAAAARLEAVEQGLREGLAQVRQVLRRSARPARLPLASAVELLAEDWEAASGVQVHVTFEPDGLAVSDVDQEVADALYRAVQEALTNAVRHGRARRVRVRLAAVGTRVQLWVEDDGAGSSALVPGMGLSGMTAAVQRLGGTIRFRTAAGEGFAVEIGVPRRRRGMGP